MSEIYVDSRTKLYFECSNGHQWAATPNKIQQGRWCPACHINTRQKTSNTEFFQILANHREGRCLDVYVDMYTPMRFECAAGHVWLALPINIKHGNTWCPFCKNKHLSINDFRELAQIKGGKCLSDVYVSSQGRLKFQCDKKHEWFAAAKHIKRGSWCPYCKLKSEQECRAKIEQLFGQKFPKRKPSWLVNEQGNRLELDGFSEEISVAFEHNGIQHYHPIDRFGGRDRFVKRVENDQQKIRQCAKHGVSLIVIPALVDILPIKDLHLFIISEARRLKIEHLVENGNEI